MFWQLFISSAVAATVNMQRASSIAMQDLVTGQSQTLSLKMPKKGLVVTFLSSRCPCSVDHEQVLKETIDLFPDFQFALIHSNADEPVDEAKKHFIEGQWKVPVLQDRGTEFADLFAAAKTPHAFVLNARGDVLFQGGVTDSRRASHSHHNYLKDALDAIRKGQRPQKAEAKTLGCAISRSQT